jgi:lipopolysaccharide transport system permease protein
MLNPLSFIIEQARGVVIFGSQPNWCGLAIYFAASLMVVRLGFGWFQRTRKGFADVL